MSRILFAEKTYGGVETLFFFVPEDYFRTTGVMSDEPMDPELLEQLEEHGFFEAGDWMFEPDNVPEDHGLRLEALGFRRDADFQDFIDQGGDEP